MALSDVLTAIVSRQPFKGIYVLLAVALGAARLPLWLVWYLPRSMRQSPKYSWRQAVRIEVVRSVLHHMSVIRVFTPILTRAPRELRADPTRFEHIPAGPAELFVGVTALVPAVKPAAIPAVWYPARPSADELADETRPLVLHFHGGAYVIGDARPDESGFAGGVLAAHVGPSLHVSYRLGTAAAPYPAQLQDAVSAYAHVVRTLGVSPKKIVLSGDSAGANLAAGLLRYLRRHRVLDEPVGALLWSPWVDVSAAVDARIMQSHRAYPTDYLTPAFAQWGAAAMVPADVPAPPRATGLGESYADVGRDGEDAEAALTIKSPYLSPKAAPFATAASLWVQAGELEVLCDDIGEFAAGMKAVPGNSVDLHVEPGACHDILLAGPLVGFEAEAHRSGEAAGKWVRDTLGLKTPAA